MTNAMTKGTSAAAILPSPQKATAMRIKMPMAAHTETAVVLSRAYRASGVVTSRLTP